MLKANSIFALVLSFAIAGCGGTEFDPMANSGDQNKADDFRDWQDKPADLHTGHALTVGREDFFKIMPGESHAFVVNVPADRHHYSLRIASQEFWILGRNVQAAWAVAEQGDIAATIESLTQQLGRCYQADPFRHCEDDAQFIKGAYMGEFEGPAQIVVLLKSEDVKSWEYDIRVNELDNMQAGGDGLILIGTVESTGFSGYEQGVSLVDTYIHQETAPYEGDTVQTAMNLPVYHRENLHTTGQDYGAAGWLPAETFIRLETCWAHLLGTAGENKTFGVFCPAIW